MNSARVYLLTNKQYKRRFGFLFLCANMGYLAYEYQRQYMFNRGDLFHLEYMRLVKNPNFYHTLHEQVALSIDLEKTKSDEDATMITE